MAAEGRLYRAAGTACTATLMLLVLPAIVPVNRHLVRAIEHLIAAYRAEISPAP